MWSASTVWCSERNFPPSWATWRNKLALWRLLDKVPVLSSSSVIWLDQVDGWCDSHCASPRSELLECDHLHSVIRLVLKTGNYMNAVSGRHSMKMSFAPSLGQSLSLGASWSTGWLRWQRYWLSNGFAAEVGRHQSKQAWDEFNALRCHGKWTLLLRFNITEGFWVTISVKFGFFADPSQQSQNVDTALLKFPEQLKHIEAASRSASLPLNISCLSFYFKWKLCATGHFLLLKYYRILRGEIEAEFQRQVKRLDVAKQDTLKQEDLKAQMEDFLQVRDQ